MTAKEYTKKTERADRQIGNIYYAKKGTRLAEWKDGTLGWLQETHRMVRRTYSISEGRWIPLEK